MLTIVRCDQPKFTPECNRALAALMADAPAMLAMIARLLNNPGVPSVEQEAIELLARHGVQP